MEDVVIVGKEKIIQKAVEKVKKFNEETDWSIFIPKLLKSKIDAMTDDSLEQIMQIIEDNNGK